MNCLQVGSVPSVAQAVRLQISAWLRICPGLVTTLCSMPEGLPLQMASAGRSIVLPVTKESAATRKISSRFLQIQHQSGALRVGAKVVALKTSNPASSFGKAKIVRLAGPTGMMQAGARPSEPSSAARMTRPWHAVSTVSAGAALAFTIATPTSRNAGVACQGHTTATVIQTSRTDAMSCG